MDKYVAFLDILGFKSTMETFGQENAERGLRKFSSTIYKIWQGYERTGSDDKGPIGGYIFSDSLIMYSRDTEEKKLKLLFKIIDEICKAEFKNNSILIRGAVAKGEFIKLEAVESPSLEKGLLVGRAYLDAYSLEGTVKTTGIVLSEDVYKDYLKCGLPEEEVFTEEKDENRRYILSYLDVDFLLEKDNLSELIRLANESEWLPHFYNTLYYALNPKKQKFDKNIFQIFENIVDLINGDKSSKNCDNLDKFISNSFSSDVNSEYQKMFVKFLRNKLYRRVSKPHQNHLHLTN